MQTVVFHRGAMWPHRRHLTASRDISGYSPGTEQAEAKDEPPESSSAPCPGC